MIKRMLIAMPKLVDIPQAMKQIIVLHRPIKMAGFRPMWSDSCPHPTAKMLCDTEKVEPTIPAHFATLF